MGATGIEPVTSAVSKLLEVFQRAPWNGELPANPPVRAAFSSFIIFKWFAAFFILLCTRCARGSKRMIDSPHQEADTEHPEERAFLLRTWRSVREGQQC